jgi:polysaccharide export outer membrane protein
MMKKYFILAAGVLLLLLFSNCSSQKKLAYFYGMEASTADSINRYFNTVHEAKICIGDMLSITVSAEVPETAAPYNLPFVGYASPGSSQLYSSPTLQAYLVDVDGQVNMPVIGLVKLVGLTKSQAITEVKKQLEPHLKDPIVTIQFLNYKVAILGEVLRPGTYVIDNERVTVLDALGLAGDMTIYGKRNNVFLIRENNGKLEFTRINLNSDEVFKSPYYYLQQNDVIYVEPNTVKTIASQNISLYLSSISTVATLATAVIAISSSMK